MQILIDIYEGYYKAIKEIPSEQCTADMLIIKNGIPLPSNTMILDKDKLECDSDYDAYYDGYTAYSQIALEAAEIKEQNNEREDSGSEQTTKCGDCALFETGACVDYGTYSDAEPCMKFLSAEKYEEMSEKERIRWQNT